MGIRHHTGASKTRPQADGYQASRSPGFPPVQCGALGLWGTGLTAWHRPGYLVWLMPPANTEKVRAVCMQKLSSTWRPSRLIRMLLQEYVC